MDLVSGQVQHNVGGRNISCLVAAAARQDGWVAGRLGGVMIGEDERRREVVVRSQEAVTAAPGDVLWLDDKDKRSASLLFLLLFLRGKDPRR